jgi:hypothetical protein
MRWGGVCGGIETGIGSGGSLAALVVFEEELVGVVEAAALLAEEVEAGTLPEEEDQFVASGVLRLEGVFLESLPFCNNSSPPGIAVVVKSPFVLLYKCCPLLVFAVVDVLSRVDEVESGMDAVGSALLVRPLLLLFVLIR